MKGRGNVWEIEGQGLVWESGHLTVAETCEGWKTKCVIIINLWYNWYKDYGFVCEFVGIEISETLYQLKMMRIELWSLR